MPWKPFSFPLNSFPPSHLSVAIKEADTLLPQQELTVIGLAETDGPHGHVGMSSATAHSCAGHCKLSIQLQAMCWRTTNAEPTIQLFDNYFLMSDSAVAGESVRAPCPSPIVLPNQNLNTVTYVSLSAIPRNCSKVFPSGGFRFRYLLIVSALLSSTPAGFPLLSANSLWLLFKPCISWSSGLSSITFPGAHLSRQLHIFYFSWSSLLPLVIDLFKSDC